MVAIGQNIKNLGTGLVNGTSQFAKELKQGLGYVAKLAVKPKEQDVVAKNIHSEVDAFYAKIDNRFKSANAALENYRENTLYAPIKKMSELKINRLEIKDADSSKAKAGKKIGNALINFHEKVIQNGEKLALEAGKIADGLTHGVLYFPVSFVAKVLRFEAAGKVIQNSIALAVGFAVRGIVLALSQLGHLAPYAAAAAVIGGTVLGLAALGHFVAPLAAVGIAVALVLAGQQLQIYLLSKKVDLLTQEVRKLNANAQAPSLVSRLRAHLPEGKTVAKSLAAALALGAASYVGYTYGNQAIELAQPYVQPGLQYAGQKLGQAQELAQPAINFVAEKATTGYSIGAEYATTAANAVVQGAEKAFAYGKGLIAQ